MKAFWCILGVLAIAAGVLLWRDVRSESSDAREAHTSEKVAASVGSAAISNSLPSTLPAESRPAESKSPGVVAGAPATAAATPAAITGAAASAPTGEPVASTSPVETVERMDHRSVRLDGRFIVHGRGDAVDPYLVPWDLLISAGEEYRPDQGLTRIPPRVEMLNGSQVTINGYLAAPLIVEETQELLVMFNKWDGCCIGLLPTPYDAVEVKLQEPVKLTGQHVIRYGAVTGTLRVDPFLLGDMLVSLYRLEDATLAWENR